MTALLSSCSDWIIPPSRPLQPTIYTESNSIIVKFGTNDSVNSVIHDDLLENDFKVIKQCKCAEDIVLYGVDSTVVDPVEKVRGAVAKVRPEEGGATIGINMNLEIPQGMGEDGLPFIDPAPGNANAAPDSEIKPNYWYYNNWFSTKIKHVARGSSAGKKDLKVAIIDTGINFEAIGASEQRLSGTTNAEESCEEFNYGQDDEIVDHGTKVALAFKETFALAFKETLEGSMFADPKGKINLNAKFLDLQIFEANQEGRGSLFSAFCALRQAVEKDVDVIVMSWGFYERKLLKDVVGQNNQKATIEFFSEMIQEANNANIPMVAAAGNGIGETSINIDKQRFFPASFAKDIDHVICVGAMKNEEESAGYSNYGNTNVTVASYDTIRYMEETFYGTSYAAPKVAVLAAYLRYSLLRDERISNEERLNALRRLKSGQLESVPWVFPFVRNANTSPQD